MGYIHYIPGKGLKHILTLHVCKALAKKATTPYPTFCYTYMFAHLSDSFRQQNS
ncbi:hypothetical protein ECH_0242 [Ehrlichia chaffeensis str. Arkansas]|uniref:Uncharacterized protein n=1 Tax=Ehrlichia chaffeensis (strain ATCC CRL-10679 / Arkansas) TaxID=205920 RepID=Q2GHM0_EHRCR|nr:hypothetical protein ECH_0242 [Ehrlichia chaffeensis str. Arkansas]AHX08108.1 hypothetical protein ECHSTV_0844 [Ehrlichia chaffeensis str. Saint Vincent]